jgi:parvulin-like peptidyl-prolyl isomerase
MATKKKGSSKKVKKVKTTESASSTSSDRGWKLGANLSKLGKNRKFSFKAIKNSKKLVFAATFVLLLAGLYFVKDWFIAVTVNGRPITRLALDRQLEQAYGSQVLEDMISKEVIMQKAKEDGITIADDEVESTIGDIRKSLEAQNTTLESALAYQGQTVDDLKENIRIQKMVEKMLSDKVSVSDEDVLGYFEENKDFYEDQELDDVKDNIRQQLEQEQLSTEAQKLLQDLKLDASINYFLKI